MKLPLFTWSRGYDRGWLPATCSPDVAAQDYLSLSAAAAGVMLIGAAEGLAAAKTYAASNHYEIDPNRELIGLGAANLGAGLSSGMVVAPVEDRRQRRGGPTIDLTAVNMLTRRAGELRREGSIS